MFTIYYICILYMFIYVYLALVRRTIDYFHFLYVFLHFPYFVEWISTAFITSKSVIFQKWHYDKIYDFPIIISNWGGKNCPSLPFASDHHVIFIKFQLIKQVWLNFMPMWIFETSRLSFFFFFYFKMFLLAQYLMERYTQYFKEHCISFYCHTSPPIHNSAQYNL